MDKLDLRKSFERLLAELQKVENITPQMLKFDGTPSDFETFGYLFYEGILPGESSDYMNAGRYVLGRVLEQQYGFVWTGVVLYHAERGITVNLLELTDNPDDDFDASEVIETSFNVIRSSLHSHGH